ncbi:MAG: hypothetical protein AAGF87_06315, partial [Bacteroidota bacterium]
MYKLKYTLMAFLVISSTIVAQNVGEARFNLPHLVLPASPLSEEFTTFSVDVSDPYDVLPSMGVTQGQIIGEMNMLNFQKVTTPGHLQIRYNIGEFLITNEQGKEDRRERERDDGSKYVEVKYYVDLTYKFPITLEVVGYDGAILYDAVIGYEEDHIRYPRRGGFNSIPEAEQSWYDNRATKLREEQTEVLTESMLAMNEAISERFDHRVETDHLFFEYPKGNRAQNAVEWESHANQAMAILAALPADQPMNVASLRSQLQPHLDWWSGQMGNYDPSNRREQKYYHSALYNMGVVEYALENSSQVIEYMTQLEGAVRWNRDRTRSLRRNAESLRGELNRYASGSRRFEMRDLSGATPPAQNNAPAAFVPHEATHPAPT